MLSGSSGRKESYDFGYRFPTAGALVVATQITSAAEGAVHPAFLLDILKLVLVSLHHLIGGFLSSLVTLFEKILVKGRARRITELFAHQLESIQVLHERSRDGLKGLGEGVGNSRVHLPLEFVDMLVYLLLGPVDGPYHFSGAATLL